jgi:hypothetical protein
MGSPSSVGVTTMRSMSSRTSSTASRAALSPFEGAVRMSGHPLLVALRGLRMQGEDLVRVA